MKIESFVVNPFQENTYVLLNDVKALLFDPGYMHPNELNLLIELLEHEKVIPEAILLTHAHLDHVFGIEMVRNRFDIPVYLHPDEFIFWDHFALMGQKYGFDLKPFDFQPIPLYEGKLTMCGVNFELLFTPGHAPGHLSFYIPEIKSVISGDALFRETVGRTDLQFGDFKVLENSIRTKLYTLPDETRVLSGHGPETTIGHEKKHNGFVRI